MLRAQIRSRPPCENSPFISPTDTTPGLGTGHPSASPLTSKPHECPVPSESHPIRTIRQSHTWSQGVPPSTRSTPDLVWDGDTPSLPSFSWEGLHDASPDQVTTAVRELTLHFAHGHNPDLIRDGGTPSLPFTPTGGLFPSLPSPTAAASTGCGGTPSRRRRHRGRWEPLRRASTLLPGLRHCRCLGGIEALSLAAFHRGTLGDRPGLPWPPSYP